MSGTSGANRVGFFEISTDDPVAAERFYGELFGWTFSEGHGDPYSLITKPVPGEEAGELVGGLWDNTKKKAPNWAIVCIQVDDVDKTCDQAVAAGGKVLYPIEATEDDPTGPIFAHLEDPAGNHIAVFMMPTVVPE